MLETYLVSVVMKSVLPCRPEVSNFFPCTLRATGFEETIRPAACRTRKAAPPTSPRSEQATSNRAVC